LDAKRRNERREEGVFRSADFPVCECEDFALALFANSFALIAVKQGRLKM